MSRVVDGRAYNRPDGKRWYLAADHHTGVPMDPMTCRWFRTKREATDAQQGGAVMVTPETLTDDMVDRYRTEVVLDCTIALSGLTATTSQGRVARQRICDAINARAKDGAR